MDCACEFFFLLLWNNFSFVFNFSFFPLISELQKDKKEAERKNKFPEVAQICNVIGELLCKYGMSDNIISFMILHCSN